MSITLTSRARTAVIATAIGGALALSACGGDPAPLNNPAAAAAPATTVPAATAAPVESPADAPVKITQTVLGDVLADVDGMALYAFTNDVDAQSTCSGTCAEAWPPVIVDPDFIVSPGLDSGIFATTIREDGAHQLVAGKWPLYRFAADAKPGDITGQGSGDVWYLVDLDGRLIETAPPEAGAAAPAPTDAPAEANGEATAEETAESDAYGSDGYGAADDDSEESADAQPAATDAVDVGPLIGVVDTDLGSVVADPDGFVLYLFLPDEAGEPTCVEGCAGAWPPLLVEGGIELLADAGIDSSLLSTVPHPDGGQQLKIGTWPLYYFAGDDAPGLTNGQGSGGDWFVVGTDGKPIK